MVKTLTRYIGKHKFLAIVIFYFLFSATLEATIGIDICIPCLFKLIFDVECMGCGLTTAFISLMELDFKKAFESNELIFIIAPLVVYFIVNDFINFKRKYEA